MRQKMKQQKTTRFQTKDLVYMALCAALITVCAWISIPAAVPFTLQTFAVFVTAALLGPRRGTLTVLVYMLLGFIGIPVFSGFKAGIGVLFGTTGGYIIGFLFTAFIVGFFTEKFGRKIVVLALSMVLGLAVCYIFGTIWFMVLYTSANGAIALGTVLSWCVIPFFLPDAAKILVAVILVNRFR